jgi:hypothetical protein
MKRKKKVDDAWRRSENSYYYHDRRSRIRRKKRIGRNGMSRRFLEEDDDCLNFFLGAALEETLLGTCADDILVLGGREETAEKLAGRGGFEEEVDMELELDGTEEADDDGGIEVINEGFERLALAGGGGTEVFEITFIDFIDLTSFLLEEESFFAEEPFLGFFL